jgi:hypothetical protein
MVHSAMQYTDFIKALFTFKVLNGFMVNVNAISHMPIREVWPSTCHYSLSAYSAAFYADLLY